MDGIELAGGQETTRVRTKGKFRKASAPKALKPTGFEDDVHGDESSVPSILKKPDADIKDRANLLLKHGLILASRRAVSEFVELHEELVERCGSPIERIFLAALMAQSQDDRQIFFPLPHWYEAGFVSIQHDKFDTEIESMMGPCGPSPTAAMVQVPIGKYRADFVLYGINATSDDRRDWLRVKLVVECDGHGFHEKTKDQAKHDKARDRYLVKAGYYVMRFTGSEIWNAPRRCVVEAHDFISDLQSKHYKDRILRGRRAGP